MHWAALGILAAIASTNGSARDTSRRYYTETAIQTMRANIAKYDWARKQRDQIIATANKWAAYDDDKLRATLIMPPQVPRAYDVHNLGCPVHGTKIYDKGLYSWIWSLDKPFKLTCPTGGEEYPSNDFAAYLATGMKDRSLLTGDCVDDGWGYHRPQDKTPGNYWFVAYYTHWVMRTYMREALNNLALAAVVAEDPAQARNYAHKCAVMLWQLAEYYPDYEYVSQSREGRDMNPNYHGKIWNRIWEALHTPGDASYAYDAIKPYLADDVELQKLAGKTAAQIDQDIRERLLVECATKITDNSNRITGNYGMHQCALLKVALALNEHEKSPTTDEMIRWVVENPKPLKTTDMGLRDAIVNLVYRDGMPAESLNYNLNWVQEISSTAGMLADCGVDLFHSEPRIRKLLNWPFDVYVCGKFTPSLGDTTNIFSLGGQWTAEIYREALRRMPDERFAWVVKKERGKGGDLFERATDDLLAEFAAKPEPSVGYKSYCFRSYGLCNLQCGTKENPVASTLFFSIHPGHMHADQLNLMIFAHDNALLPDIGYPEQPDHYNWRMAGYFKNTIAHNTVTVDAIMQDRLPTTLHGLSLGGLAQVVDASAEGAYPKTTSLFRRANMLVEADGDHSYLFDAFYVRGGKQHDFAIHGTQADFTCQPALGRVQKWGTLAGVNVPYEQFYDDPNLKDKPLGTVRYTGYGGSGYQFLTNVQRAPLEGYAVGDWKLTEPLKGQPKREWKDIGIRAHYLGQGEELISCDGPLQRYEFLPRTVKCLIRRRTGENLQSRFVSVFEPYKGLPWIKQVSAVTITPDDGNACAALVELANGGKHYVFHSITPDQTYTLDGRVSVRGQSACLVLDAEGKPVKAMLQNGTLLKLGGYVVKGKGIRRSTIKSVDYAKGIIELADPVLARDVRPDSVALIRGSGFNESVSLSKVIDRTHFSIGDEDLRVAGAPVVELRDKEIITTIQTPNAIAGMTLLNSRLEVKGRLEKRGSSGWIINRPTPLKPEDFPTAEGDSGPRFYVMVAGPGDEVLIPDCVIKD